MAEEEGKKGNGPRTYRPLLLAIEVADADGQPVAAAVQGKCVVRTRDPNIKNMVEKLGTRPGMIVVSVETH